MRSNGVRFKMLWGSMWSEGVYDFENERYRYQICEQPLPEWREEMTEETKPDPREEIPHRELQIQWHEDMLHHLRTGEPMKKWQCKPDGDNRWFDYTGLPTWDRDCEYRRKPRTVKYLHCLVDGYGTTGVVYLIESTSDALRNHVKSLGYDVIGQITETTVEVEN